MSARPRRWGCAVFALIGLLLVGGIVAIPLVNDASARGVEAALRELPVPLGTEVVDGSAAAGKFSGNGNGMQYLGALLVRTGDSAAQLQAIYDAQPEPHDASAVSVIPTGGEKAEQLRRAGGVFTLPASDELLIVYAWGDGPPWFFQTADLRGH